MASISGVQSSSSAYDVFLSFHGEDTRNNNNNFTGFLFQALRRKGIVAFKGHTLPEKGEPGLLHAIEGSRLFIVVLSKNYASSTRCLRELAHIFNCIETSPRRLLPIFYDVDPSDVRKQTGRYEEAFWKHEQRFLVDKERMEEVRTWRKALSRVANLPGWYIPNKPQYTEIEEFVQYIITILGPNISTLQNEAEGTSSDKDEVSYNELSGLMRIRDFISLVLTYPGKLEDENILRSWISAFPEWKAQLLSTGDDTVMDKPWCVLTDKALGPMKGFMPMEIISKVESGERSIFSHNDVDAIPEAILQQSVDLAVNQLLQTLFSGDYCARYIRLLTRNLAEKGSVVDTIVSAVEDKHTMFGIDKDFLRALWINASTYETDAEVRVQEEIDINMMMEVDDMGSNGQLVIVVDADSNNKLDLQKLRFPTGIVVLITTEPSTQAEKDVDFRIACTMDLNIWTQDHLLPWKVFCSYVGSCISSSMVSSSMAIQKIAVEIVKESHGHLLAIVLVAKYLTYVQDFKQWELALDKLSSLNPSYDYQDSDRIGISRVMVNAFVNIIWEDIDDAQKLCLELSLPVHNIKNGVRDDILVSDWAKIISGYTQELGEYRRQLQHYINELQDRFVLLKYESGDVYLPVETYDIIKSLHTSKPSILRHGALGLTEPPYIGRWHSLIQIELMDNKICELPQSPDCPKLKVLLLQGNVDLMDIPDSFFNHMPLLQHLDLSYTSIRDLPPSVSKLIQLQKFYLRGCDLFMELPHQIGQLKNLKELDLDGTLITHLPIEIRELINLQSLSLCFDGTSRSTIIPPGLVSNLTQLNYLSINVDPEDERWNENVISVLREIFFGLWNLQRLSIYVPKADLLEFIPLLPAQKSLNFRLVVGQHMRRLISRVPPELETKFKHCDYSIKFVNGVNVPNGVKMHLERFKALYLDRHMTIKSLSDFDLRNLWGLEVCILAECNEMETIVRGSNSLMLKFLSVFYMKNLRSICEGSSPFFLCLKSIALHTCPMLTTIFTLDSLEKLSFLEEIIIEDCPKVTTLISHATPEQKPVFFLPKLRMISLLYLPELVNIFNGMHVGPFIEEMIFYYCPSLQSLSKSELSSKSLKIIKGESIWWEALKWNVAEWGDAGRPNYFERIFSPINEEADMMNRLAALQETQLNEYHNTTYQGISSSTQSIAKSSLEIPVLSPLAPVSSVGRGSSNSEAQKRKVVTEPKILQDASKKVREQRTVQTEVWTEPEVWTEKISVNADGSLDDGYSWRKYGLKKILGAKFPRGYYKCTYGSERGCPARKQVQRLDENPATFEITYQGRHTCTKEQNLIIKSGDEGISSSTQSIAKSSLEIPVLSLSAPVSSVGRGSSNIEAQKRKVVTEPKIFQDASKKCNLIVKKGNLGRDLSVMCGTFKDGDLLVNRDGVRIVSQNDVEAPPQIKPTDNQLTLADIDVIKVVGEGNGGVVQLVQHKWTRQFFVLKVIQMNIEESMRKQIAQELKITQQAQCPYVVVCYQSFYENGVISILLEYMDGGSLADLLKKVKTIPEDYLAAICKQVLKGLVYLHHEKHIIHRDLKPSNLLINHIGEVKITDFGVSTIMESTSGQANTFIGTYNYMSPERIIGSQRGYNYKSDIWSLGLILLECALGRFPYAPPDQSETWESIFELMETIVDKPPPSPPSEQFSTEFCSFISACLQKDPKDRLSAQELMAHPFVNMYDDLEVDLSAYFSNADELKNQLLESLQGFCI